MLEKLEPMPVKSTGERQEKQRDEPSPLGPCGETAETLKKTATRVRRTCGMLEAERTGGLGLCGSDPTPRQAFTHAAGTPDPHQCSGRVLWKSASSR